MVPRLLEPRHMHVVLYGDAIFDNAA
jgi:hypothetical protein